MLSNRLILADLVSYYKVCEMWTVQGGARVTGHSMFGNRQAVSGAFCLSLYLPNRDLRSTPYVRFCNMDVCTLQQITSCVFIIELIEGIFHICRTGRTASVV
jgi:hypothetical protein